MIQPHVMAMMMMLVTRMMEDDDDSFNYDDSVDNVEYDGVNYDVEYGDYVKYDDDDVDNECWLWRWSCVMILMVFEKPLTDGQEVRVYEV